MRPPPWWLIINEEERSMTRWPQRALLALCSIGLCTGASANLTFSGTLNEPPPCTIDCRQQRVDFGDVGIRRIPGAIQQGVGYNHHWALTPPLGAETEAQRYSNSVDGSRCIPNTAWYSGFFNKVPSYSTPNGHHPSSHRPWSRPRQAARCVLTPRVLPQWPRFGRIRVGAELCNMRSP